MSDVPEADIHQFPRTRPRVKKLRLFLVLSGLGLLAVVSTAFGMMMAVAADLDELESEADIRRGTRNSVLVDMHGKELGVLRSPDNRIIVRENQIAPVMKNAVISIEDKRFYEHEGVDLRGVGRAFVQDVLQRKAVQGASTIPQQLVKNRLRAENERTVFQKVRESALAYHLSRKWDKDKILSEYLNSIYFGNGAYGIESAARTYFGREPDHEGCGTEDRPCAAELKPEEAAMLAGIIASPGMYDPVSRPAAAKDRRDLVLRRMMEQEFITPAQFSDLVGLAGPADVQPPREEVREDAPTTPYFTTWVKQQIVDRYGARDAFTGGLKIRTTIDLEMQKAAEQAVGRWLANPAGPTAAMVAIDNDSGEVRAMVGGRDYNEAPFNLATQGQRQPGSAFKPFTLATALKEGISAGSTWSSRKLNISSKEYGCDFEVNNYENAYSGVASLTSATTFSDNSVYAQVGLKVGLKDIAKTAKSMGIRTPVSKNCAMTLGGLKEGVTPLDMAHAYQTFATGGNLVTGSLGPEGGPVGIREVCKMNAKGNCKGDIDENKEQRKRVLPQGVADQVKSILSTVVTSGTAVRARLDQFAAGKTGTTENYGDAWFVGFTDELTVAVWVGYPDKLTPMTTEYGGQPVAGGTYPADIWRDFMVAATAVIEQRRAEEGGDDEEEETSTAAVPAPAPVGEPDGSGEVAPEAEGEVPTPNGGDPRPEQPEQPQVEAAPPAEEQAPAPTPQPQSGGGGGGGGGSGNGSGGIAPPSGR